MRRIAYDLVEVDDVVKVSRRANPLVDRLAVGLAGGARMVVVRVHVGRDGRSDDAYPVRVGTHDDLLIGSQNPMDEQVVFRSGDIAVTREAAEIIDALQ